MKKIFFIILLFNLSVSAQYLPLNKLIELRKLSNAEITKQLIDDDWNYNGVFLSKYIWLEKGNFSNDRKFSEISIGVEEDYIAIKTYNKEFYKMYLSEINKSNTFIWVKDELNGSGIVTFYKYENNKISIFNNGSINTPWYYIRIYSFQN